MRRGDEGEHRRRACGETRWLRHSLLGGERAWRSGSESGSVNTMCILESECVMKTADVDGCRPR